MSSYGMDYDDVIDRDDERLVGEDLVGRLINLKWEDGKRYDALVVRYYPEANEYKLVYPDDEGVEVACIKDREWYLKRKQISTDDNKILTGCIIKFVYPKDQRSYKAMIYHHSDNGAQLKVCYLDEHSTDAIGGRGWTFLTESPCAITLPGKRSRTFKSIKDETIGNHHHPTNTTTTMNRTEDIMNQGMTTTDANPNVGIDVGDSVNVNRTVHTENYNQNEYTTYGREDVLSAKEFERRQTVRECRGSNVGTGVMARQQQRLVQHTDDGVTYNLETRRGRIAKKPWVK